MNCIKNANAQNKTNNFHIKFQILVLCCFFYHFFPFVFQCFILSLPAVITRRMSVDACKENKDKLSIKSETRYKERKRARRKQKEKEPSMPHVHIAVYLRMRQNLPENYITKQTLLLIYKLYFQEQKPDPDPQLFTLLSFQILEEWGEQRPICPL